MFECTVKTFVLGPYFFRTVAGSQYEPIQYLIHDEFFLFTPNESSMPFFTVNRICRDGECLNALCIMYIELFANMALSGVLPNILATF